MRACGSAAAARWDALRPPHTAARPHGSRPLGGHPLAPQETQRVPRPHRRPPAGKGRVSERWVVATPWRDALCPSPAHPGPQTLTQVVNVQRRRESSQGDLRPQLSTGWCSCDYPSFRCPRICPAAASAPCCGIIFCCLTKCQIQARFRMRTGCPPPRPSLRRPCQQCDGAAASPRAVGLHVPASPKRARSMAAHTCNLRSVQLAFCRSFMPEGRCWRCCAAASALSSACARAASSDTGGVECTATVRRPRTCPLATHVVGA